jgi:predicted AAA+ superfamily ATPase
MMIFKRALTQTLLRFSKLPVVGVFGPRQSGKTTLVKEVFNKHKYINFEDPAMRSFVADNPQGFLREFENDHGIILDEFQYVPQILSYIQMAADEKDRPGYFVLTGSQNFLMNETVTQSLAGRIGILTLLPLSIHELTSNDLITDNVHEIIYKGGYPRIYAKGVLPAELYPSYIHSYVERDVRQLVNVENLSTFQRFMQLCVARISQQLNVADLATSCGISQKTVNSWLSLLQASYIIFLLSPYHNNFSKRVVKTPKLYFYDTGLACSLLNIRSSEELALSTFKGPFFESFIIADLFKQYYSRGTRAPLYYWRDANGRIEVDCLVDHGTSLTPIEIKSNEIINKSYFDNLTKFHEIAETKASESFIIYAGIHQQTRTGGNVVGWQASGALINKLEKSE